jgi:hypothetical protein
LALKPPKEMFIWNLLNTLSSSSWTLSFKFIDWCGMNVNKNHVEPARLALCTTSYHVEPARLALCTTSYRQ